jgi:L-threonylcarbamoyladenylate synthase
LASLPISPFKSADKHRPILFLAYAFVVNSDPTQLLSALNSAAAHLIGGGLVAFPTETVYGLGANAEDELAVAKIYRAKNRPADHPLIIHIAHSSDVTHFAKDIPDYAQELMQKFWPGPMTLILNRSEKAADFVTGSQGTVGLRVPNHAVALALLLAFKNQGGHGIAAPSANRYGSVSPTTAKAVEIELGEFLSDDDIILDGGPSEVGLESTIIDCTAGAPRILRPGAISAEMIRDATKLQIKQASDATIRVSGSHQKHYSPRAKVVIDQIASVGEGLIALSSEQTPPGAIRLAAPKNLDEFAAVLYAALREADQRNIAVVHISAPPGEGLAIAIRDRIQRAAS